MTPANIRRATRSTYVTTRCNFPHDLTDGVPIGHECEVIPPAALRAEIDGDFATALDIIESAKRVRGFGQRALPTHRGKR